MSGEEFPKSERLLRRVDFLRIQQGGRKASSGMLLALALPNGLSLTRVGFTVSSKVGNAVIRNRVRRRLRELFRRNKKALPAGIDVVFIARPEAAKVDFQQLSQCFAAVAQRLRGVMR